MQKTLNAQWIASELDVGRSSSPCVAGFAEQGWALDVGRFPIRP